MNYEAIEKLRKQAFELTAAEQYRLAFFIAENIGHIIITKAELESAWYSGSE